MRDVRLGVEFVFAINAALDLARAQRLDDRGHPGEKIILQFLGLNAVVQMAGHLRDGLYE